MAHRVAMIVGLLLAGFILLAHPRASGVWESTSPMSVLAAPVGPAADHHGTCPGMSDHGHRGCCAMAGCGATYAGLPDGAVTVPAASARARFALAAMASRVGINAVPAIPPPRYRA